MKQQKQEREKKFSLFPSGNGSCLNRGLILLSKSKNDALKTFIIAEVITRSKGCYNLISPNASSVLGTNRFQRQPTNYTKLRICDSPDRNHEIFGIDAPAFFFREPPPPRTSDSIPGVIQKNHLFLDARFKIILSSTQQIVVEELGRRKNPLCEA